MEGFFSDSEIMTEPPQSLFPKCEACGLYKRCHTKKMPPSGEGKKRILIIAEAPGSQEDRDGIQFVGKTGQYLEGVLRNVGINMRRDCVMTNSIICWPWEVRDGKKMNRKPTDKELDYCRPNLINTINSVKPEIIITIGGRPIRTLFHGIWKKKVKGVGQWVGWQIPSQHYNAWVCPTWHPSFVVREKNPVVDRMFEQHLANAVSKTSRPWKHVPDYTKKVQRIQDHRLAAKIMEIIQRGKLVAFDYETNMLKPEHDDAEIVSCSVSDGITTASYPFYGKAVTATQELIRSDLPKIASNMKFEERWTWQRFGHGVNNWDWDTMLAAHWLDNRDGITSVKFQAFVLLGAPVWDANIEPFLSTEKDHGCVKNRIRDIAIDDLLLYNGLGSLLEYKVAAIQKKKGHYNE